MKPPEFPREFVLRHCGRVREERYNRLYYCGETISDDEAAQYAECAFHSAGYGLMCENCKMHINPMPPINEHDVFVPSIRQYYVDMDRYEKYLNEEQRTADYADYYGAGI